ncbi:MAG: GNAT family N-acetyltransferase [Flavobacteriales bacterium]|nr:GNAT family N-acetyltransferase [Flavobacteriales bacterium]MCB9193850.1 GNAT family N-acetyltransferase [Flavobacteriales bacterium]
MTRIRKATTSDVRLIGDLARTIWPKVYADVITEGQIAYMLVRMYSDAALAAQMTVLRHAFLIAEMEEGPNGFASCEHHHGGSRTTRLHKLYVLPDHHGLGIGQALLTQVLWMALEQSDERIDLTVNKRNRAVGFYERQGFRITHDQEVDIGGGYVMDDHVMARNITGQDQFADVGS